GAIVGLVIVWFTISGPAPRRGHVGELLGIYARTEPHDERLDLRTFVPELFDLRRRIGKGVAAPSGAVGDDDDEVVARLVLEGPVLGDTFESVAGGGVKIDLVAVAVLGLAQEG